MNLKHPPCRMLLQRPLNWCPISVDRLKMIYSLKNVLHRDAQGQLRDEFQATQGYLINVVLPKPSNWSRDLSGRAVPTTQSSKRKCYTSTTSRCQKNERDKLIIWNTQTKVCDIEQRRGRVKPRCALINEVMNKYNWAELFRKMERPGWRKSKMNNRP